MIFATARPGTHTKPAKTLGFSTGSPKTLAESGFGRGLPAKQVSTFSTFAPGLESIQNYRKHSVFSAVHRKAYQKSSSAETVEACLLSRFPYFPRLRPPKTFKNTVFLHVLGKIGPTQGTTSPASPASPALSASMSAMDAGDAGDMLNKSSKSLNKFTNPSPLSSECSLRSTRSERGVNLE